MVKIHTNFKRKDMLDIRAIMRITASIIWLKAKQHDICMERLKVCGEKGTNKLRTPGETRVDCWRSKATNSNIPECAKRPGIHIKRMTNYCLS